MFSSAPARWLALLPALAALGLSAQETAPAAASQAATALSFESALQGYRPFTDQAVQPWKEANDTVGRIGGWRSYAREAAQAEAPATAPATPAEAAGPSAPATAPGTHGDPGMHHGQPGHPGHTGHHGRQP